MGSPEGSTNNTSKLPSLQFSRGSLNRLIQEERWLVKRLQDIRETKKHCEGLIKMADSFLCEYCNNFYLLDEEENIETASGIQSVCHGCYRKYLEEKD